jgi:hypothetical protein
MYVNNLLLSRQKYAAFIRKGVDFLNAQATVTSVL